MTAATLLPVPPEAEVLVRLMRQVNRRLQREHPEVFAARDVAPVATQAQDQHSRRRATRRTDTQRQAA